VIDYRFHTSSMSRDKEGMLKGIMRALDQPKRRLSLLPLRREGFANAAVWRH
jgi:hypothetical protein